MIQSCSRPEKTCRKGQKGTGWFDGTGRESGQTPGLNSFSENKSCFPAGFTRMQNLDSTAGGSSRRVRDARSGLINTVRLCSVNSTQLTIKREKKKRLLSLFLACSGISQHYWNPPLPSFFFGTAATAAGVMWGTGGASQQCRPLK